MHSFCIAEVVKLAASFATHGQTDRRIGTRNTTGLYLVQPALSVADLSPQGQQRVPIPDSGGRGIDIRLFLDYTMIIAVSSHGTFEVLGPVVYVVPRLAKERQTEIVSTYTYAFYLLYSFLGLAYMHVW